MMTMMTMMMMVVLVVTYSYTAACGQIMLGVVC